MGNILEIVIGVIIFVAVGVTLTQQFQDDRLDLRVVTNETVTLSANAQDGFNGTIDLNNDEISSLVVSNSTAVIVLDTDYSVNTGGGIVTFITNYSISAFNASYNYEGVGYVSGGAARTVVGLLALFVALGAIVMVAKGTDLLN